MTDRFTVRAVIIGLIVFSLAVVGVLLLTMLHVDINADQKGVIIGSLTSMGSLAIGALAAILARTSSPAQAGEMVEVVDEPPPIAN